MAFEKVTNRERLARKIVKKKGTKAVRKHFKKNPLSKEPLGRYNIEGYMDNLHKVRSDAEEKARKKNIIVKLLTKKKKK